MICLAYEKAILVEPTEENIRIWVEYTRMTPEEMEDKAAESIELADTFTTIAGIILEKILPEDWRCADDDSGRSAE